MRVIFLMDPVSGWTWWTPQSLVEDEPQSREDDRDASHRAAGQGLVLRLLGRAGTWFGICEQTRSGVWRRLRVARRDPWEPGIRRNHSSVWSWWCP